MSTEPVGFSAADLAESAVRMGIADPPSGLLSRASDPEWSRPPKLVVYGQPGIGKTTFGASAPNPFFILTEDGLARIRGRDHRGRTLRPKALPVCRYLSDATKQLDALMHEDHPYQTVVIDGLDGLQPLLFAEVAREHGKENIGDISHYRGYISYSPPKMRDILERLDRLNIDRGMAVILLAHEEAVKVEPPDSEPYDRYVPSVEKRLRVLVERWPDAILFARYRELVVKREGQDPRAPKKGRGIGEGERIMLTEGRPAWTAKNPYGLPLEMPFEWDAFMAAFAAGIPQPTEPQPEPATQNQNEDKTDA